jgi:3-methyl-2-oxobutanoate hydroxymethyltransferase
MADEKKINEHDHEKIGMAPIERGRKTVWHIQQMKDDGKKIVQVCPANNDPLFSMFCEMAGVDIIRYTAPGENSQHRAENLCWWTREIRKMAPNINLNAAMQTAQYADKQTALKEAANILSDGADSVLCMGITNDTLQYLSDNHVAVHGHVGVLSGWQTGKFGGYRRVGNTAEKAMDVYRQAYEYQECGMVGMTIEMTPIEVTNAIAKKLRVPVISVAAGGAADGSEIVHFDLFGMVPPEKMSKWAKVYGNLIQFCVGAYKDFADEVRGGAFPTDDNGYKMDEKELDTFLNQIEKA